MRMTAIGMGLAAAVLCGCEQEGGTSVMRAVRVAQESPPEPAALGALDYWDDGLAEVCYYDAQRVVYDTARTYTLVAIAVREFHDPARWVKTAGGEGDGAARVLKLLLAEEIPTDNYNYRFETVLIADRDTLAPRALTATSQEWCGTSFRRVVWGERFATLREFSYLDALGTRERELAASVRPLEGTLLAARDRVSRAGLESGGAEQTWLPTARTIGWLKVDDAAPATWEVVGRERVRTRAGVFQTVRLRLVPTSAGSVAGLASRADSAGSSGGAVDGAMAGASDEGLGEREPLAEVWVAERRPHWVVKFALGDTRGTLAHVERRAYWEVGSQSRFYKPGAAP